MEDDHPLRILFVEDVPADAELAARALRKEGLAFTSTRVETKAAFLKALEEFKPDVIVSDYAMPEFDGMQALKLSLERAAAVPFILLTGSMNEETAVACMKAGATDYVLKDRLSRLPFAVREALEQKRAHLAEEEAERTLREREQRFRSLIENASDLIVILNPDYTIAYVSPSVERILGYTVAAVTGARITDFIDPQELPNFITATEHRTRTPGPSPFSMQVRVHHADGSWRILEGMGNNLLGQPGVSGLVINARDITERKEAEERLAKLNDCLLSFGSNSNENINRLVAFLGEQLGATCALYNRLEGNQLHSLGQWNTPPDFNPMDKPDGHICYDVIQSGGAEARVIRDLLQTSYAQTDPNVVRYGLKTYVGKAVSYGGAFVGSLCVVYQEDRIPNQDDLNLLGIVASGVGVEEKRKQEDQELRESENRLRLIVEGTQALLVSVDATGHFTYANDATARALGSASPAELIGKAYLHFVHPEDRQRVLDTFINQVNTRQPSSMQEFRITDTEGKVKWLSFLSTLAIKDGQVVGESGVAQDITDHKRAEAALVTSEAKLRALFASMRDVVLVIDRERIYREIAPTNPAFWYIPPQELLGKRLQDVFPAEQSEVFYGAIHQVLDTKRNTQIEYELVVGNQSVWYEASISPMDADSTLWVARDITERKRVEEEISRRNADLAVLYQIGQAFNQLIQPNEILERIYSILGQVLDNRNLYIALFDEVNQSISFPVYTIDGARRQDTPSRPVRNGLTEYVLRTKTPLLISHDLEASLAERGIDSVGRPSRCYLAAPILTGEKALGVIAVQEYEREDVFHKNDLELLVTVASQTATALENARLFEETRRRAEQFAALYDITRDLAGERELNSLLETIVERAARLLKVSSAAMFLYDAAHQEVELSVARGLSLPFGARLPVGEGLAGKVAQTRLPIRVDDYQTWEFRSDQYADIPFRAMLEVPMLFRGELIGVLAVHETGASTRVFTDADAQLLALFASQAAGAVHNARLHEETLRQLGQLEALHSIDIAIGASMDLRMTLNVLLEHVKTQLNADATSVLLLNPHSHTLEYAAGRGFRTRDVQTAHIRLGENFAGRAALERRTVRVDDPAQIQKSPHFAALWAGEGFAAYYGVPLIAKGEVKGALEVYHRAPFRPEPEWISFLETLAGQAAIAIDNAQLFENLQRSNAELERAYDTTIEGWSRALDLRDKETEGHTQRVTEMAVELARALGLAQAELVHVRRGALLHDIGKMGVPDGILLKPGKLTDEEWVAMRGHPQLAYDMLSPINYLHAALDIPYCHHEKWDGSGYPRGLNGEQIPLAARVFAIVDVWDALTSDRPYRPAWSREKTLEHIREQAGKHFDPRVVTVFTTLLAEKESV